MSNPVIIGDAELWLGDCREILPEIGKADLAIVDPPYGNVVKERWDRFARGKFDAFLAECVSLLREVLVFNGSLFWFCYPNNAALCETALGARFRVLSHIVWRKGDPLRPASSWAFGSDTDALRTFFPETERILFCEQFAGDMTASDEAGYEDQCRELHRRVYGAGPFAVSIAHRRVVAGLQRWQVDTACAPSKKPTGLCYRWEEGACLPTPEQYIEFCRLVGDQREYEALRQEYEALRQEYEALRRPFRAGALKTDLWEFRPPLGGERNGHPCEKPVRMLAEMIRQTTRERATVVDPFMGSGGCGIACAQLGRRFVGIELDPKHFNAAAKRIDEALRQGRLFDHRPPPPIQEAMPL